MSGRSIWAVVAGLLVNVVVATVVDQILHATGVYPPPPTPLSAGGAALATCYRFLIGVAGGWVTARLAPSNPMKHALILGTIGIVLGLVGVIVTWNANLGPRWYAIALVVLAIPQSWLGAKIFEMQASRRVLS